jgi:hypothetical protein
MHVNSRCHQCTSTAATRLKIAGAEAMTYPYSMKVILSDCDLERQINFRQDTIREQSATTVELLQFCDFGNICSKSSI